MLIGFSMVRKCHWHCSETTIFSIIIFVQQDKTVLKLVTNFDTCLCFASAKRVFFARDLRRQKFAKALPKANAKFVWRWCQRHCQMRACFINWRVWQHAESPRMPEHLNESALKLEKKWYINTNIDIYIYIEYIYIYIENIYIYIYIYILIYQYIYISVNKTILYICQ